MSSESKFRRPRAGLLAFSSRRFHDLGKGTATGTYFERIKKETLQIASALEGELELVETVEVTDYESLDEACRSIDAAAVDCIIAFFHSWAEDNVWIRFLRDYAKETPLLYYYPSKTGISYENLDDENDFVQFLADGGLVGMLVGSGSLKRRGREAKVISGSIGKVKDRIITYVEACRLRTILRESTFGIMPNHNEIMWSTYVDPYRLFSYGPELRFLGYQELYEAGEQVSDGEIQGWKRILDAKIERYDAIDEEKYDASLRYSIALNEIMKSYGLDAMTLNDVSVRIFEEIGLRPGFYHEGINERKSILCPEGDLGIAMAEFLLKMITGKQVNIIEPFYVDESRGIFCGGHAGPNDYTGSIDGEYVRTAVDARFAKTSYRYAGAPFAWLRIPPGQMTMLHVSECDGKLKMVVSLVEAIEGKHRINSYSHGEFKPVGSDVNTFFEQIMGIGTTQHFAVAPGDGREILIEFAQLTGIECSLV